MNEGTWVQGKSMNVMHQTGNIAWSIFDADYGKYNRMSLEKGTGGGMFWDTMSASVGQKFTDDDVTCPLWKATSLLAIPSRPIPLRSWPISMVCLQMK